MSKVAVAVRQPGLSWFGEDGAQTWVYSGGREGALVG